MARPVAVIDLDVVPWLQLGAAIAIFASVLTAQPATPPPAPILANLVGWPDVTQDGAELLAQRSIAWADAAHRVLPLPGGDATTIGVAYGGTIGWATACEGCPVGSYVPWFGVVAASYYSWPSWLQQLPGAVPGYDWWALDPAVSWVGLPLGVLTVPAAGELSGWGPGELWVIAWDVPPSPYVLGLRVCAQWLRHDASGIYLSDLWCVRIV